MRAAIYEPLKSLMKIAGAYGAASSELQAKMRQGSIRFPLAQILSADQEPTFENLEGAIHALKTWVSFTDEDLLRALEDETRLDLDARLDAIGQWEPLRANILTQYVGSPETGLKAVPHFYGGAVPDGERVYHNLGEAAWARNAKAGTSPVAVSVFDHPLKAEPLYDGALWLETGERKQVGMSSKYRIAIMDGEIHHPPLWPADLKRIGAAELSEEPSP